MFSIKHTLSSFFTIIILASGSLLIGTAGDAQKACAEGVGNSCGTTCTIQGCEGGPDPCHSFTCSDGTEVNCGMMADVPQEQ